MNPTRRPLGNVIVIMPPLVISEGELAFLLDVVTESIQAVASSFVLSPLAGEG